MVSTASTMGSLGSPAPAFSLPNTNPAAGEKTVSLSDYASNSALLVAFICNHCPYVIHIREALVQFAKDYAPRGLALVAISANDADNYPDDSPAKMSDEAVRHGFSFPYLYDEASRWPKPTEPPARRIFFYLIARCAWSIVVSSMPVDPKAMNRLQESTCVMPLMRFLRVVSSQISKSPVSAAASSGKTAEHRITFPPEHVASGVPCKP